METWVRNASRATVAEGKGRVWACRKESRGRTRPVSSPSFHQLPRSEVQNAWIVVGIAHPLHLRPDGPRTSEEMGKKPFVRTFPTEEELENRAGEPLSSFENKEHVVREKMVEVETVKLLRERVKACYRREGVNHYQNCKEIVNAYMEHLKHAGINRLNTLSKR